MMKTKQYYYMTDHTCAVYAENEIEFLWAIESSADCDENHIRQLHD